MTNTQHMHTQAVHAGEHPDPSYGDSVAAIHMATTYYLGSAEEGADLFSGQRDGFVYNRWGSPNQSMLEEKVAALEGAETALATATGMAAISTALFSVMKAGDHVVATDSLYSGTQHIIAHELPRFGIETSIVDATDPANVERALRPNTTLLYLETPGNPTLKISDIAALTAIAKQRGILTFSTTRSPRPPTSARWSWAWT